MEIKRVLDLDETELKALAPVYKRYEAELNKLNSERQGKLLRSNPDSLSTEETDLLVKTRLDNAVKISTIRQQFYPEFKAVLSPRQVMKLYNSEAKLRRKVMLEFRKRFKNRQK